MMLSKTALPAFVTLIYASKVAAQITATLPWVPDDGDGDLDDFSDDDHLASGLILGTGSNGETTYLLTMSDNDDNNRPITATLVADAAGATVLGAYSDEDNDNHDADDPRSESFSIGCGIQSGNAVCTYQRVGVLGSSTFTSVTTRTAAADTITVVASTGTAPSAASTASGSSSGSTRSGSATASGATATQSSGALENAAVGLFAGAVPLVLAAFAMA